MDYEVKVAAGQLFLMSRELSEQDKEDVLNSQLFAHLYASSKADKFCEMYRWDYHLNIALQQSKFITTSTVASKTKLLADNNVSVGALIIQGLAVAKVSEAQSNAVLNALSLLAKHPVAHQVFYRAVMNDAPLCFPKAYGPTTCISLSVSLVEAQAQLITVSLQLVVRSTFNHDLISKEFLGEEVTGPMLSAVSRSELLCTQYGEVRKKILDMVEAKREALIVNVDAAPPIGLV